MIVVSNTSPLTNLAAIGRFDLLHTLYGELHIAVGVWQELNAFGQSWPGSHETAVAHWITQHTVQNRHMVSVLQRDLDLGEAETIALAVALSADLILLDERDGRHAASRLGLPVAGTLGVLLAAKHKRVISEVHSDLIALKTKAGFYISQKVIDQVLQLAGETQPD